MVIIMLRLAYEHSQQPCVVYGLAPAHRPAQGCCANISLSLSLCLSLSLSLSLSQACCASLSLPLPLPPLPPLPLPLRSRSVDEAVGYACDVWHSCMRVGYGVTGMGCADSTAVPLLDSHAAPCTLDSHTPLLLLLGMEMYVEEKSGYPAHPHRPQHLPATITHTYVCT